jgi:hypothetical protein
MPEKDFFRIDYFTPVHDGPCLKLPLRLHVEIELCGFNLDLPVAEW